MSRAFQKRQQGSRRGADHLRKGRLKTPSAWRFSWAREMPLAMQVKLSMTNCQIGIMLWL